MITTTYQTILNLAGANAGRTADKFPPSEQTLCLGWIDADLQTIWQGNVWAELIQLAGASVPVVNHQFSKQEGQPGEMGDLLGYYTRQPHRLDDEPRFDFSEGDNVVNIDSHAQAVWPVYQTPCPDLLAIAPANLMATPLPRQFKNYLAFRAGGNLLKADGDVSGAGVAWQMAAEMLSRAHARNFDKLPRWMKEVRFPRRRHAHHWTMGAAVAGQ